MPRQAAKTDTNQPEIVQALRDVGATVFVLARVGQGIPDLAVGYRGRNYFLEVKNMDGRGDKLTPAEKEFHDTWRGQVAVVRNEAEALAVIGAVAYNANPLPGGVFDLSEEDDPWMDKDWHLVEGLA